MTVFGDKKKKRGEIGFEFDSTMDKFFRKRGVTAERFNHRQPLKPVEVGSFPVTKCDYNGPDDRTRTINQMMNKLSTPNLVDLRLVDGNCVDEDLVASEIDNLDGGCKGLNDG